MKSNNPTRTKKSSNAAEHLPRQSRTVRLGAVVVATVTAVGFLPVLGNQFVGWDDYENLVDNPYYRGLGWTQLRWMFTTFHMGPYQPLSWMSLGLDYLIWGMNPVGYHLTNLVLHAANAVLFYFICGRLLTLASSTDSDKEPFRLTLTAAFAAVLFSLHPLRVESVAWATERRDLMAGLFFLCTLSCYLNANSTPRSDASSRRWKNTALVFYLLSLLSKAITITLPAVLIILDIYPLRRLKWNPRLWLFAAARRVLQEKIPFILVAVPFAFIALVGQQQAADLKSLDSHSLGSRLGQAFFGASFYLWKTLVPLKLSPLYEIPSQFSPLDPEILGGGLATVIVAISFYLLRYRWPAGLVCWMYSIVVLAPVLGIVQAGPQLVADRYSYLSCLGWPLLIAGALLYCRPSSHLKRDQKPQIVTASALAVVAVSILGFLTWEQIRVWRDTRTFWEYVVVVAPHSSIAHYNLGKTRETEGQADRAIELYRRAVKLNDRYLEARYNLARLLARSDRQEEAIEHYRRALEINPADADTHNNLGLLLAARGELSASLQELQKAVQIDPTYARAYFNLGRIFAQQGDLETAVVNYQRALELNPNEPEIYLGLGNVFARDGQLEAASAHFQMAVQLKPDFADAHLALARSLAAQGKKSEAEKRYEKALQLLKSRSQTPSSR